MRCLGRPPGRCFPQGRERRTDIEVFEFGEAELAEGTSGCDVVPAQRKLYQMLSPEVDQALDGSDAVATQLQPLQAGEADWGY